MRAGLLVDIPAGSVIMQGSLEVPEGARGTVLFAHGSGSSRHSPRNKRVAARLREAGFGTLLVDLLSPEEDRDPDTRFDIPLLTRRLGVAASWLARDPDLPPLGLFGASTGAAAAVRLAADAGPRIAAVVSRGGRPDLAGPAELEAVAAPTLLIVGGHDGAVLELNRAALAVLRCEKELVVIPGATHLFEETGALEAVSEFAADWFGRHLVSA